MQLSNKQNQMLEEIMTCADDNAEIDQEYMNKVASQNIPKIFSPWYDHVTLSYEDYLGSCKMRRAIILENTFNLEPFKPVIEEISNNEIILYRSYLENVLQDGLNALMEIQFLDSLVILRKDTCEEKLAYNSDMKNIMFVMKNLVKLFDLNPPTVANEIYQSEKIKAMRDYNIDVRYKSPEDLEYIISNISLKSMSMALAMQHKCLIDNSSKKKKCEAKDHQLIGRNRIIF